MNLKKIQKQKQKTNTKNEIIKYKIVQIQINSRIYWLIIFRFVVKNLVTLRSSFQKESIEKQQKAKQTRIIKNNITNEIK